MKFNTTLGGISILGLILIAFVGIIVLGYFGVSVEDVVESPGAQDNINYVKEGSGSFWDKYFAQPISYFWNKIWIPLFWDSFVSNLERIRDGKPTDYQLNAPQVNIP